jgi:hypothetical protein
LAELNGDNNEDSQITELRQKLQQIDQTEREEQAIESAYSISISSLIVRMVILFIFGVIYGQFSKHLHDNHSITSYTLDLNNFSLILWGSQGILLGFLLPFFDWMFPYNAMSAKENISSKGGKNWSSVIRAIGGFVGVVYGLGKFSWSSTSQSAFYFGMVNPCLWYILDSTRNGFILSCITAVLGTLSFATFFPNHLPTPEFSEPYLSVTIWIASVFFCFSICFGNIGRRLLAL